jgi:hypothetical protein
MGMEVHDFFCFFTVVILTGDQYPIRKPAIKLPSSSSYQS